MTKAKFCKTLKKVEDIWNLENNIDDLLTDYGRKYDEDIQILGISTSLMSDVIVLLAEIMQDEGQDIDFFCYELNFGKDWEPGTIVDKDGTDVDFSTAEKLYDYLETHKK